ncbi:hypothetical protein [Paenibacillus aceris]|uniref:Uncharacterized protein n=1 Tax=Paenibacillus aceris TaxID=869555 RepID=A0ABS4I5C9_9BACL|nr:hypothetical protein [Paenibacillus aceris]MBP1966038.1 hypothetical protein [Paenibacillus aceris]NHW39735.1 hypothetical protein [Paenibacillus aceris]
MKWTPALHLLTCGTDFVPKSVNEVSGVRKQRDTTFFANITAAVSEA